MPSSRRPALRRFLAPALAALALLAAGHTALWFYATDRLQQEFAAWQAQRRAEGWTISSGTPVRAGWPTEAALELSDLTVSGGEADLPGGLAWQAAQAELAVVPLRPGQLEVRARGAQRMRLAVLPDVGFTAGRFVITIPLDSGVPVQSAELSATGVQADLPGGGPAIAALTARGDMQPAATKDEPALILTGSAEAIGLPVQPGGRPWSFGPRIASVSFDAALSGPVPGGSDLGARVAAWRDGGGTLEVRRLALGWGPLGLSGSATLSVDDAMQPLGAARVRLVGYDSSLDALVGSGTLAARQAQAAKGVLALLARPPEGGGAPQVELPVTLQDRTLTVAKFPLLRLPQWQWP